MADQADSNSIQSTVKNSINRAVRSRWMPFWLVVLSFLENTVLLIAIEPLFIPIMARRHREVWLMAGMLTLGSVLGGIAAYALAFSMFEPVLEPILNYFELLKEFQGIKTDLEEQGYWPLFLVGVTPVPFQLGTLSAGLIGMRLDGFIAVIAISRGIRYFGLAALVRVFGSKLEKMLDRYETPMMIGFFLIFVGLIVYSLVA